MATDLQLAKMVKLLRFRCAGVNSVREKFYVDTFHRTRPPREIYVDIFHRTRPPGLSCHLISVPSTLYGSKKESLAGGQHYSIGMLNHHTSKRKHADLVHCCHITVLLEI